MSELAWRSTSQDPRFVHGGAWYVTTAHAGLWRSIVGAPAEQVMDVVYHLLGFFDPAVDMLLRDLRSGRTWQGSLLPLPDVREAVGRLRQTLVAFGAVECAVYTDQDQFTITRDRLLIIDSRTDRWTYRLDAASFESRSQLPPPTWNPERVTRRRDAALEEALWVAAERLGLEERRA
ncbi:hypothetical protein [Gemmatimonas sp. UBA7669]|uniref:hypothetical protein n=1 Tax=Gemmatimonas sp. UBA7669 TaxID=1946568 RepID=UPI0025C4904F|nr:hypothetical protein [Gemmatimonas sp. UBA7669]